MKTKAAPKKPTTNKKKKIEHPTPYGQVLATEKPLLGNEYHVKHLANPGDVVASLASLKKLYELTGRKTAYLQVVGAKGSYYQGATHPTTNEAGEFVTMNEKMFEMIKPLVEYQDYIQGFHKYVGQKVHLNFDDIRGKINVGMPNGMLPAWIMYAFPDLCADLSKPWLSVPDGSDWEVTKKVKGKVIINLTERYRNPGQIEYHFLKRYAPDLIFAGVPREHLMFCNMYGVNIPLLEVKDFLELAVAIKNCRFLLANQSMCWNIADAMKTPRLLEVCAFAPNCQPMIGENSYGFMYQEGVEHWFREMYNTL